MRVRSYLVAGISAATLAIGLTGCPGLVPGADPSTSTSPAPTSDAANSTIHEGTISSNQTWTKAQSPHIVRGDVTVESDAGATLTIEPGAEVRFEEGASLTFGWNTTGVLKAVGTAENPIVFTSARVSKAKGDWDRLYIGKGGASSALKYCQVKYAGGNSAEAALVVDGAANKPTIENCTFDENKGMAILADHASSFTSFANNTLKNSEAAAMRLDPEAVGTLGTGNTFTGNGQQVIEVTTKTVAKDVRWRHQGIPYRILGDITIEGSSAPTLTLDPGCTLEFASGTSMYVSWNEAGALYAKGTADQTITFTSVPSNRNKGAWGTLTFKQYAVAGDSANLHSSYLEHAVIEYGGGNGGTDTGGVVILDSKPLFSNVTIQHSNGYGIYIDGNDVSIPPRNTFESPAVTTSDLEVTSSWIRYPVFSD